MKKIILFFVCLLFCSYSCRTVHRYNSLRKKLQVKETGGSAQIEIGGPYVGIEMHASSPLLNRISFFYPVANSIDLSEDYWKRDQYHVLSLGLKVGDQPKQWLGLESSDLELTPFSAHFRKSDEQRTINISYHFCKHKPAMVAFITVTSNLQTTVPFEIYTHLETSLKTCHSYKLKDKAWTEFHDAGSTLYTHFDDSETGNAQIFVANAGEKPDSYTTVS
ncbi:MAG: hypothetical protein JXR87_07125, partial [Candidatus Marinimicrobia bacterium]|nr:hypothetical protein [Candidatus Neomarinimicrobiota bacterium]